MCACVCVCVYVCVCVCAFVCLCICVCVCICVLAHMCMWGVRVCVWVCGCGWMCVCAFVLSTKVIFRLLPVRKVAKHSTHYPKIEAFNPTNGTEREQNASHIKVFMGINKNILFWDQKLHNECKIRWVQYNKTTHCSETNCRVTL